MNSTIEHLSKDDGGHTPLRLGDMSRNVSPHFPGIKILTGMTIIGWRSLRGMVNRPELILYLLALSIPYQTGIYIESLFGITFTPQLILSSLLIVVLGIRVLIKSQIKSPPLMIWWSALVMLSTVAYFQSPSIVNPIQGMWVIYRLVFMNALIYPITLWVLSTRSQIRMTLIILAASTAVSGLIAIVQAISGGQLLSGIFTTGRFLGFLFPFPPEVLDYSEVLQAHFYIDHVFRAHGTFYRVNGYGALVSIIAGLTWGLVRGAPKKKQRAIFSLLLGIQMIATIVTFSRTAWVAVVVALAVAIAVETLFQGKRRLSRRGLKAIIAIFLVTGLIFVVALQSEAVFQRLLTIFQPNDVGEVSWRLNIWRRAFESIKEHPWFGAGSSIVVEEKNLIGELKFGAHNLFVGIAYELGLPALGIFLYLIFRLLRSAWHWFTLAGDRSDKMVAIGMIAAVTAFIVTGMGSATLGIENIAMLFWMLLAITIKSERLAAKCGGKSIRPTSLHLSQARHQGHE